MSGGSYNYLYCKEPEEFMNYTGDLEDMSDQLNQLGYEDVARDMRRLLEYIKSAKIRIEVLSKKLSPVMKAVEWYDSADWGLETLDKEIQKYREGGAI